MPSKQTRGERAICWIEVYCLVPNGLDRGQHVRLTPAQRDIVREITRMAPKGLPQSLGRSRRISPYCTFAAPRHCKKHSGLS